MLADNLIFLRNIKGLTQEQVAEVIGISRQSYSKWEQGCLHSGTEKYSYTEESTTFRVMAPPDYIPHLFRHHSEDEAAGTGYSVRYI